MRLDPRERNHFVFDTTFELRERFRTHITRGRSNVLWNKILESIVALAESNEGQHILLAIELGMLNVAESMTIAAHTKGIVAMMFTRMVEVNGIIIEEYEYQGRMIVFKNGQQVLDKTYDELVKEAQNASNT